jgi:hypothetical protein
MMANNDPKLVMWSGLWEGTSHHTTNVLSPSNDQKEKKAGMMHGSLPIGTTVVDQIIVFKGVHHFLDDFFF